jgi:hypothetical protein
MESSAWGYNWATLSLGDRVQGHGPSGCELGARLTTLLCKQIIATKSKEVKTGCNLAETSKEVYGSKRVVLPMLMMII